MSDSDLKDLQEKFLERILFPHIEKEEGFRPCAYKDHLGYWTIGFGTLIDERKGGGITKEQGWCLVRDHLRNIYTSLDQRVSWWRELNDVRKVVLVSMAYQMGIHGLMGFKNTLRMIKEEDYAGAADGMRNSLWARQTPVRAERMARAMETGSEEALR